MRISYDRNDAFTAKFIHNKIVIGKSSLIIVTQMIFNSDGLLLQNN